MAKRTTTAYCSGACQKRASRRRLGHRDRTQEMVQRTCEVCGLVWTTRRKDARFCSDTCKGASYSVTMQLTCPLPPDHPVLLLIQEQRRRQLECCWCGTSFSTINSQQTYCSKGCHTRAHHARRRGRAFGWASHYTWTEVIKLFLMFGRRCAYCEQRIDGAPDPDHVVPLSRGGSDSITHILPSCHACNCDKRDLLLEEWAEDRARRGLPPRVTSWSYTDPRTRHLTSIEAV